MGNDINDVECIEVAGIGVAVADSCHQVIRIANYITLTKVREGAFREICEFITYAKGGSSLSIKYGKFDRYSATLHCHPGMLGVGRKMI